MANRKEGLVRAACFFISLASFGLTGLPGWSRLPLILGAGLIVLRLLGKGRGAFVVPAWQIPVGIFLLVISLTSIQTISDSYPALLTVTSAWGVALVLGLMMTHAPNSQAVLLGASIATILNAVAIATGFESFAVEHAAQFGVSADVALRRPSGLVGNSNLAAINAVLPLVMITLAGPRAVHRLWFLCVVLAAGYVVYTTGSRKGVWFFALWMLIAVSALQAGKRKNLLLLGSSIVVVACVPIYIGADWDMLSLVDGSETYRRLEALWQGGDTSTGDRKYFFKAAWELFLHRPWFGYGLDQFKYVSGTGLYSHATFLELAIGGGLFLLASYYAISISLFAKCLALVRTNHSLAKVGALYLLSAISVVSLDVGMVSYYEKSLAIFWVFAFTGISRWSRGP